jgi:hypothetical protein
MAVSILKVGGTESVPLATAGDLAEKSLDRSLPWELRELVHGADQEGRKKPVYLLICHHDR